jgi:hypothetical protein
MRAPGSKAVRMRRLEHEDAQLYAEKLGRLQGNLLSLEFVLRAFLVNDALMYTVEGGVSQAFPQHSSLDKLKVGDCVPVNAFTNYDTLGQLIAKYNTRVNRAANDLCIDAELVDVRDAIAHGRVSAPDIAEPLHLLKFSKPEPGINSVRVTHSIFLTAAWLSSQIKRVGEAILKVQEANERLAGGGIVSGRSRV